MDGGGCLFAQICVVLAVILVGVWFSFFADAATEDIRDVQDVKTPRAA